MKDRFRPAFHFTPPNNWLNDPNGLVYYEGEYHLFYQHNPDSPTWGPMYWGHAISTNLIEWRHLPVALAPDQHGTIFSGSVVVDWKDTTGFFNGKPGLVAIFTHNLNDPERKQRLQRQSLAYSPDSGRSWIKYAANPVLADEHEDDFRDPKVFWHADTRSWIMVLALNNRIRIYASPDLIHWSLQSEFGEKSGDHGGVWECPDLFELPIDGDIRNKKWVMLVSVGTHPERPEGSRTQYFIGEFDGRTFVNDHGEGETLWLDGGRDNYAGVSWSDIPPDDGRRIYIGWMSNWKYANVTPSQGWRGAMTLPRELSLGSSAEGVRLFQRPIAELRQWRQTPHEWRNVHLSPGKSIEFDLQTGTLEIRAEFEPDTAANFGLKIRKGESEETIIGYNTTQRLLYIDRTRSGITDFHDDFPCKHGMLAALQNGKINLHIIVDHASVEVFAQNGEHAMTDLIFPDPGSCSLEVFTEEGGMRLIGLTVYPIRRCV